MLPELGQFALVLATLLAAAQALLPLFGAWRGSAALIGVARPAAYGQFVFTATAFTLLTVAFVQQDFSVAYVAQNSNLLLPVPYRFSAVWGAHEGSLLLWVLILGAWTIAVAAFSRRLPDVVVARVLGVMASSAWASCCSRCSPRTRSCAICRRCPMGAISIRCCRTPASSSIRRCSTRATSASRWRSPSPSRHCSAASSINVGCAGRGRGRMRPGLSSRSASRSVRGGPITNWAGAAGGSGIRSRTRASCPGWWALR